MKIIIAGGRNYRFTGKDKSLLNELWSLEDKPEEVVSGGCSGADQQGEAWADEHGLPVKVFPANWDKFGRAAGAIRNRQMAEYADAVALFPGGAGTISMHREANRAKLKIFDFR